MPATGIAVLLTFYILQSLENYLKSVHCSTYSKYTINSVRIFPFQKVSKAKKR